ncbi:MAG: tyrosine-type recombinase/integrase [FCB group bacterium]|nr:tyrosine-type recombinase/integrase [FCB group bacterium]
MKKSKKELSSIFAEDILRYLQHRKNLGRGNQVELYLLSAFDEYVNQVSFNGELNTEIALNFAYSKPDLTQVQYDRRYSIIRHFSKYLSLINLDISPLPAQAMKGKTHRRLAHIYTDEEITALLQEAGKLQPADSLRPLTYSTLIGLLYSTGIRISEAIKLDMDDVDFQSGIIRIRESKFRKSRLIPVHPTTLKVLVDYRTACNESFSKIDTAAFFINQRGKRVSYSTVVATFLSCVRKAGIRDTTGLGPRLHDLRHTFAVKRVVEWYKAGEDVQAKLSELATFMGHAHFEATTYYLTAGAEIMSLASQRFEKSGREVNHAI